MRKQKINTCRLCSERLQKEKEKKKKTKIKANKQSQINIF